ncbi:NAD-dependent epimerase/dehydratase family protein [Mycolicibacterium diernhoferi]|uniref:Dehydrogenase n=1 Tax=Mycolicibacterium diernhoferi TaxID=1801 RepID=A0A1Q4HDG9_9MYCO|nr:NAD-dependent epimerase/dehydratase family protein [Mycolicibacterium diernhoferi]OJZ65492.1 dehydrogenase [Mycolicibacterium diernhoferi]OPE54745.1 dehydrogenase [Mycolicibacterium diernhoferi]PEG51922.1 dehydrogenase [Mycolicibacterium diernhoferi]QYL22233.1 NAD-dependent epimerase/dehydratase family protein [Mycolicibacterium diernhoferi]
MRIAMTGGTGYLGAHTVKGLLEAGHEVRLLVAPGEDAVIPHLQALGELTVLAGDIRDAAIITRLLDGCDAVIHAAGVVGTDRRREALMWEINAHATEAMLTRAAEAGLDPIVSVSSYSALFPPPDGVITADTPPAPGRSPYAQTKAYADRAARTLQAQGAPVVVTYPSSVVGPAFHTAAGVTERGWAPIVAGGAAPRMPGGMQMVDVRDVAEVHRRLMRPGNGPRRYVCGGVMVSFNEMIDTLERGSGKRIRRIPLSPKLFRGIGWISDVAGRVLPLGDGISYEAAMLLTAATPTDDAVTLTDLGMDSWRSPQQAILESFRR